MTPVERLLTQLEAQIRDAREALEDEHEGDVRRAVGLIAADSHELLRIVSTW